MNTILKRAMNLLLFALLLVALLCGIVYADGADIPEGDPVNSEYQTIAQFSASLTISNGTATCIGRVTLKDLYTGTLTVTLQRQVGSSWIDVTSWSGSVPAGGYKKVEGTYSLSIHGIYRVKANLVSGNENEDTFSRLVSY